MKEKSLTNSDFQDYFVSSWEADWKELMLQKNITDEENKQLCHMSKTLDHHIFWSVGRVVVENEEGKIIGAAVFARSSHEEDFAKFEARRESKADDEVFDCDLYKISMIYVLPEYRKQGYGKKLLDMCLLSIANIQGNSTVNKWSVHIEANGNCENLLLSKFEKNFWLKINDNPKLPGFTNYVNNFEFTIVKEE